MPAPILLTGDLSAIGFSNSVDLLEFQFDILGGDLFNLYGGGNLSGGILLTQLGFSGNWANDFNSNSNFSGVADVGVLSAIPIPAAFWLFGTVLIGMVGFGRPRKAA